ncbi:hypothetical protein ANN_17413 [Periplaneta americana]|uniref:Uncharacterized protein n=1 Tax=Periplaneta americana TaxID=6978 RepID=A0ABQ8SSW2_PERAM|nr:hypothetical protein ANN_17413 [Periplaneta americana]
MAGLCEGSNEPPGSLKAISKKSVSYRVDKNALLALSEEDEDLFNSQVNRTLYTVYRDNIDKFSHMWEQQFNVKSIFTSSFITIIKYVALQPAKAKTDQPAAGLTATCQAEVDDHPTRMEVSQLAR